MNEAIQAMTVYTARCRGNAGNTHYPDRQAITCADDLKRAAAFDHVCAEYKNGLRSVETFVKADCLPFDLDNDHSDNPDEWKTLEDIQATFPGVPFYAIPSRHHLKPKDGKAARPKWHVYFPIDTVTNAEEYRAMKEEVLELFPWFDARAKDAARFLFGVDGAEVITMGGDGA